MFIESLSSQLIYSASNQIAPLWKSAALFHQHVEINDYRFPRQNEPLLPDQVQKMRAALSRLNYHGNLPDSLFRFDFYPKNERNSAPETYGVTYDDGDGAHAVNSYVIGWNCAVEADGFGIPVEKLQGWAAVHEVGHKLVRAIFRHNPPEAEEEVFAEHFVSQIVPLTSAFLIAVQLARHNIEEGSDKEQIAAHYLLALADNGIDPANFMLNLDHRLKVGGKDLNVYRNYFSVVAKNRGKTSSQLESDVASAFNTRLMNAAARTYRRYA